MQAPFLTSVLDGCVVSVTPRPRFTPSENTPRTHWTGGRVGLRAGLDTENREKNPLPLLGMEPRSSSLEADTILTELPQHLAANKTLHKLQSFHFTVCLTA
jgi:hypothetical protein